MELIYVIVENGEHKKVTYDVYEKYDGEKYRKFPNMGVKFLQGYLRGYW